MDELQFNVEIGRFNLNEQENLLGELLCVHLSKILVLRED
jgi:hypothetical protein